MRDENTFTEVEGFAEFDRLFPHGFAGPDVIAEIAPRRIAGLPG